MKSFPTIKLCSLGLASYRPPEYFYWFPIWLLVLDHVRSKFRLLLATIGIHRQKTNKQYSWKIIKLFSLYYNKKNYFWPRSLNSVPAKLKQCAFSSSASLVKRDELTSIQIAICKAIGGNLSITSDSLDWYQYGMPCLLCLTHGPCDWSHWVNRSAQ